MKIIKVGALWCAGCLITNKAFKEINIKYPNISILHLDYDLNEEEVKKYDVGKTLPVIIFLDDKENEIKRIIGEKTIKEIEECIDEFIN